VVSPPLRSGQNLSRASYLAASPANLVGTLTPHGEPLLGLFSFVWSRSKGPNWITNPKRYSQI
jgi:hypothetical protein